MTRAHVFLTGAALIAAAVAIVDAPAPRADDGARYALAAIAGAGAGAFVTDTTSGETMFCTPDHCRRLAVRAPEDAAAPQPTTLDRILRDAPPGPASPPTGPAAGGVNPLLRDF